MEDIHEQPLPAVPAGPARRLRAAAVPAGGRLGPQPAGLPAGRARRFRGGDHRGFRNIVTFHGRASRSAFWWFFLGAIIIDVIGAVIGNAVHVVAIQYIIYVVVTIVTVSLAVRRLHDSGKSGFWWLIGFIPVIGTITLIVFYCLPGRLGRISTTHSGT